MFDREDFNENTIAQGNCVVHEILGVTQGLEFPHTYSLTSSAMCGQSSNQPPLDIAK